MVLSAELSRNLPRGTLVSLPLYPRATGLHVNIWVAVLGIPLFSLETNVQSDIRNLEAAWEIANGEKSYPPLPEGSDHFFSLLGQC